jgi:hypothetical protein
MIDIKGPAVDPEAFRVEGHCCGIRLRVLKELTEQGIRFELSPEMKAELAAAGVCSGQLAIGLPVEGLLRTTSCSN